MNSDQSTAYGKLCSIFYDATKAYAPKAEVDFYSRFIEENPGRVLEAMSGSGRLQIPLIQRGYIVDGVDNSESMLARCHARFKELNISPEIYGIYKQNLEDLNLPHKYSTITIAVGSFQLICGPESALKVLKNLARHMGPNGNFLIDFFVPGFDDESRSERVARIDNHTVIKLTTRYVYDFENKLADGFCNYELIVDGQVIERESELITVTWYREAELEDLFSRAGLKIVKIYDETFRASGPSRVLQARLTHGPTLRY